MSSPHDYILGTHDAEARRLGLQHRLWSDAAHDLWKRAAIRPGSRVLDAGCGPGFASFDLAQLVAGAEPVGQVVGVDESERYIAHARAGAESRGLGNILRAVTGDVQKLAEVLKGEAPFDAAYTRWVMCFVPDPEAVIAGIAAALKPGGRFAINDYFNYEAMTLAPRSDAFTRLIKAVGTSWRSRGGDPDIMARVPALCRRHGLEVTHLAAHQRTARPADSMWAWPDTFFRIFSPALVDGGFLTKSEAAAWLADWEAATKNPDAFMALPTVYELVAVKR